MDYDRVGRSDRKEATAWCGGYQVRIIKGKNMAYSNNGGQGQGRSFNNRQSGDSSRQGQGGGFRRDAGTDRNMGGEKRENTSREFKEDPNKVGIAYEKQTKAGATYLSVTLTKDVPVGAKLSIFPNDKVKNRTEKTPTHIVKLAVTKKAG
jgi:hypothetical protein